MSCQQKAICALRYTEQFEGMQCNVTLLYKSTKKEFFFCSRTKPHQLRLLIKKAFHLQSQIKYLRHLNGSVTLDVHEIFNFPNENQFEVFLEEDSDREKSETCSQQNMSKYSGRKHPPSERELLDSKFYVDDFQFFMSEVDESKANRYFGIVFFSNKKKALFLGKKILRQLVFEFDQIEFFYALHPIKRHNSSALLGQVLVFSLFRGRKMVHEREFPEQITAAEQIVSYVKNLIKVGVLNFNQAAQTVGRKKPKNLISVCEQRSFDQKNDVLPKSQKFQQKNMTTQLLKVNMITPNRQIEQQSSPPLKGQSVIKEQSPLANQISFETQFYQPAWFTAGNALNKLEKGILSALIKEGNSNCTSFCQSLELKRTEKQALNIKLLKVYLNEVIDSYFSRFSQQQIHYIHQNFDNRKSFVFSLLLKLQKFGHIQDFISDIQSQFQKIREKQNTKVQKQQQIPDNTLRKKSSIGSNQPNLAVSMYVNMLKEMQRKKKSFSIKLVQPDQNDDPMSPQRQNITLLGKFSKISGSNESIARLYHRRQLQYFKPHLGQVKFEQEYSEADIAHIKALLQNRDMFLIENFVPSESSKKKFSRMSPQIVKKYLQSIQPRYANLRERTNLSQSNKNKLHKLEMFMSLLYFLYVRHKQRHINKKQLKAFFYLYTWSDLNVLSACQTYLVYGDINDIMDTLYILDYTYYLNGKYGIDMNEVEGFTVTIESQLIMLFIICDEIEKVEDRLATEKFIRAGDVSLYKLYHDFSLSPSDFIRKSIELCSQNKKTLDEHTQNTNKEEIYREERNKERCNFIQQIAPVHFKTLKTRIPDVHECINQNEPVIHEIFDAYDKTNELVKWIDSFKAYVENLSQMHMHSLLKKWSDKLGEATYEVVKSGSKQEILKAIYESYMITRDEEDTIDSIEHLLKQIQKAERSISNSPTSVAKEKSRVEKAQEPQRISLMGGGKR